MKDGGDDNFRSRQKSHKQLLQRESGPLLWFQIELFLDLLASILDFA